MILPILLGIVALAVGWQVIRRPVIRRLAWRDATRRPRETALVILGSLLGTALITGSFIVGDTLDSSIRASIRNQLGPIDEVVDVGDPNAAVTLAADLAALDDARIDGVLPIVTVPSAFASDASGRQLAEPGGQLLEVDLAAARSFGDDPAITGIVGPTPDRGEVVLGVDLAERLQVEPGDDINAFVYGEELALEVVRVLPRTGVAGYWRGFESTSPNAFVAPGTLATVARPPLPQGATPPTAQVLVSNLGGIEGGRDLSDEVTTLIEDTATGAFRVEEVKRRGLEEAESAGAEFGELFLGIGSFAIIAGILLLVNIFVMLSEERKSQLGMLRAVGMRRGFLVRLFTIEGAFYAFVAGVLGALLGIGVGWAIVKVAAPIFGDFDDFSLDLTFAFEPESLVTGFCAGVLIALATIFGTSLRISRINIIRAIRDLPEPRTYEARTRTVIIGSLVAAGALAAFVPSLTNDDLWFAAVLGPPVALFALLPLLSRLFKRRVAVLIASTGSLFWEVFGDRITGGQLFGAGDIFAFVLQGTVLTFAAVILLTQIQENFEGTIRRIAARSLPLRLSIAYPLARRARTGLTLGMFSLVIFTMTFISVLSNVFGGQVETAVAKEGGAEILVTASGSNPPAASAIESYDGVEDVATTTFGQALFTTATVDEPVAWNTTGVDEQFLAVGPPRLEQLPAGTSQEEAWQELIDDPRAIAVPEFFLQMGGGPPSQSIEIGDEVVAIDPLTGRRVTRHIVGFIGNDFTFSGSYSSKESVAELLGPRAAASRFFVGVEDGASPADVARTLQGELVEHGVEADPIRSIVEEFQQANLQFFRLMQSYLALGLIVGIAGLGVVMVRAVRERRRDVGVLRSLGFLPYQVRRAFVLESGFVAFQGIVVGVILALVTASQLVASDAFGEGIAFLVPWSEIAVLTAAALAASLLATAWPAQEASKIPPAVALRLAD